MAGGREIRTPEITFPPDLRDREKRHLRKNR